MWLYRDTPLLPAPAEPNVCSSESPPLPAPASRPCPSGQCGCTETLPCSRLQRSRMFVAASRHRSLPQRGSMFVLLKGLSRKKLTPCAPQEIIFGGEPRNLGHLEPRPPQFFGLRAFICSRRR